MLREGESVCHRIEITAKGANLQEVNEERVSALITSLSWCQEWEPLWFPLQVGNPFFIILTIFIKYTAM